jgi:hypothetical protein
MTREQGRLQLERNSSTNPKPDLGAQASSAGNADSTLLPTVIAEAFNSRAINASRISRNKISCVSVQSMLQPHAPFSEASAANPMN